MPTLDPTAFFTQLRNHMGTTASVAYSTTPRALFKYLAVEDGAATTYSVLRPYDGSLRYVPIGRMSVQCKTVGPDDPAALAQSVALWQSLRDASGRPLRMKQLTGYRINGILNLGAPAIIDRDDRGRPTVVFNFDVEYIATA